MPIGCALGVILALLAGAGGASAQPKYLLAETVKEGDCFHVQIDLTLQGELRISRDGKPTSLKLTAAVSHEFSERVLHVGPTGLADRSARIYETAKAEITVADSCSRRTLRPERRLVAAQRHKDQPLAYSPAGPLTYEEAELIGGHFDSLALTGLLPGREVAVGERWKVPPAVVQALCHFEGLTEHDLTGKLDKVEGKTAHVSITGSATGIDLGALVKLKVEAVCRFDLESGRLVRLEWKQHDEREQGPANPAATLRAATVLRRTPIEPPSSLSLVALVSVPVDFNPPEPMIQIAYRDPQGRFELMHGREWHLVGQTADHVILRMLDRGDFVAQLTVTPWTPAEKGKHLSPEAFKEAMADTPGWEPDRELQAGEVPAADGRWIYRISAVGSLDGVEVLQNFYLVAGPGGEQVVLAFTMSPKQAERLGSRDLAIVGSVDFPSSRKDAPTKP
ncbi:MAG TPA: hypothetical protein VNK04_09635 [Gemmataceae bacterium]|nr:hypothetical protein [Gemmataceae bacterium]